MAEQSKIEWTDSTFNPWIGCTKVSPACDHCYAEAMMSTRMGRVKWGAGQPRQRTSAANWRQPVRWNARGFRECCKCGHRGDTGEWSGADPLGCPACGSHDWKQASRRVFCASLSDWLDNDVDVHWLADLLSLIHRTPNLDWLLLSKRIGNWRDRISAVVDLFEHRMVVSGRGDNHGYAMARNWLAGEAPSNVWLGSTVVDQPEADRDIPKLLAVPARIRFLSVEPMLGAINIEPCLLSSYDKAAHDAQMPPGLDRTDKIDWIICGGESGPHARPMHPNWVRSLRDQCAAAGTEFLLKQWGEWASYRPEAGGNLRRDVDRGHVALVHPSARDDMQIFVASGGRSTEPGSTYMRRVGKRAAGRLLDGVEHNGLPEVRHG